MELGLNVKHLVGLKMIIDVGKFATGQGLRLIMLALKNGWTIFFNRGTIIFKAK